MNPRRIGYEPTALPTELRRHSIFNYTTLYLNNQVTDGKKRLPTAPHFFVISGDVRWKKLFTLKNLLLFAKFATERQVQKTGTE